MFDNVQKILPKAKFLPAAAPSLIAQAETALDFRMPDWLRDLYKRCNGIIGDHETYLYPLDGAENLVSWNQFLRNEWNFHIRDLKENEPETDWEERGPNRMLIIGTDLGVENWAIRCGDDKTIFGYDVRSVEERAIIASDFVEACAGHARFVHDIHEKRYRGREFYWPKKRQAVDARDIDSLYHELIALSAPKTRPNGQWQFQQIQRAISQRPGEQGELFIIPIADEELRIVSRDGNLPFIMRLKVCSIEYVLSCIVWSVKDAADRIISIKDAVWIQRKRQLDVPVLRQIWCDAGERVAELDSVANSLCKRDDNRLEEENRLGDER